jgi:hypothetical protein
MFPWNQPTPSSLLSPPLRGAVLPSPAHIQGRADRSERRSMVRRSPGQASSRTSRGSGGRRNGRPTPRQPRRPVDRSPGNPESGRSGEDPQPGDPTAMFARRGTAGLLRSRRTVVTQAGRNRAGSLAVPSGNRPASRMSMSRLTTMTTAARPTLISRPHTRRRHDADHAERRTGAAHDGGRPGPPRFTPVRARWARSARSGCPACGRRLHRPVTGGPRPPGRPPSRTPPPRTPRHR